MLVPAPNSYIPGWVGDGMVVWVGDGMVVWVGDSMVVWVGIGEARK